MFALHHPPHDSGQSRDGRSPVGQPSSNIATVARSRRSTASPTRSTWDANGMARVCTICAHLERAAIDQALVNNEPLRDIAGRFGLTKSSVERHKAEHVPVLLTKAKEAQTVADADDLLRQAGALRSKAMSLLLKAEQAGDYRTALAGVREARGCLELLGKLQGQLSDGANINVIVAPAWIELRAVIMDALQAFPEARTAVAARLLAVEDGDHDRAA
jgi:hypothetical protein